MSSNFSKQVRNPFSGTTVDPDATELSAGAPPFSDTDPDFAPPRFEDKPKSGVRQSGEDMKVGARQPAHDTLDSLSDRPTLETPSEPTAVTSDLLSPESLEKLDECLRGEISAVQTYDLALHNLEATEIHGALRQLRDSHDRRVTLIRDRIRAWGAVPSETSGAWGAFARLVQRGADLFGDRAAISALEEGEDHGLKVYTEDLDDVDLDTREFIRNELLPDQRRTHDLCRSLYRFVKAA